MKSSDRIWKLRALHCTYISQSLVCGLRRLHAHGIAWWECKVGSSSQANCLMRNTAMDDSIGGS